MTGITGIVLAGGKSSRMGRDKALLEVNGKPLIQYAVDSLKPLCDKVIISSNSALYGFTGCGHWTDLIPVNAPMAGIYSCLSRSETSLNLIHTCDMPMVTDELFQYLLSHSPGYRVVVPVHGNGLIEPLCGLYMKDNVSEMQASLDMQKYSLHQFIRQSNANPVSINESLPFYRIDMFSNINTTADLAKISPQF